MPARKRTASRRGGKVLRPRSVRGIRPLTLSETYDLLAEFYGEVEHRPRLPPVDRRGRSYPTELVHPGRRLQEVPGEHHRSTLSRNLYAPVDRIRAHSRDVQRSTAHGAPHEGRARDLGDRS